MMEGLKRRLRNVFTNARATPAVKDKLGVGGWVRRDKERLVEYRALTRGR